MRSRYIIVLIVLVPFMPVFAEQYFLGRIESPSVGAYASGLPLIFLVVWWMLRDSAERNVSVPYYLKILVVLIAGVGLHNLARQYHHSPRSGRPYSLS